MLIFWFIPSKSTPTKTISVGIKTDHLASSIKKKIIINDFIVAILFWDCLFIN
jgi:hypothetical protein